MFKSKLILVAFRGDKMEVIPPLHLKERLCGLCGNLNDEKKDDLENAKQCLVSKPSLVQASFRVSIPSKPCPAGLESRVEQELSRDNERCIRPKTVPTKLGYKTHSRRHHVTVDSDIYRHQSQSDEEISAEMRDEEEFSRRSGGRRDNRCSVRSHFIMEKGDEVCFSLLPWKSCETPCEPQGSEMRRISFHCMTKSRKTEELKRKIREGKHISWLADKSTDAVRSYDIPEKCAPVHW